MESGTARKFILSVVSLISGVLLFLALFSMQMSSILFNNAFQTKALEELSLYEKVHEIAEAAPTINSNFNITQMESIIGNPLTPDLIRLNIQSLTDGMIEFLKGHTQALPDLYLAVASENDDPANSFSAEEANITAQLPNTADSAEAVWSSAPLSTRESPEKINLQLLFMFYGEQNISDILLTVSLIQFILHYLPLFSVLLLTSIGTVLFHTSFTLLKSWIRMTIPVFTIFCFGTAILFQILLYPGLPLLISLGEIPVPVIENMLADYFSTIVNELILRLVLSGSILFAGSETILFVQYIVFNKNGHLSQFTNLEHYSFTNDKKPQYLPKKAILCLSILVLLSTISIFQLNAANRNFSERDLNRAVTYLRGNAHYSWITDARDNDVCFLGIKVVDSATNLPVRELETVIYSKNITDNQYKRSVTDKEGSASFLLEQGSYRVLINSSNPAVSGNRNIIKEPVYDFELNMPGRTELLITLKDSNSASIQIDNTFIQYIP